MTISCFLTIMASVAVLLGCAVVLVLLRALYLIDKGNRKGK